MRVLNKRFSRALYLAATSSSSSPSSSFRPHASLISRTLTTCQRSQPLINSSDHASRGVLAAPWSATQHRCVKIRGSDVKPGQVVERKGKIYQVLKAQHNQQGRGGAVIQVELRDVDSGNKTNERIRTEEAVERVFVEEKSYKYLYTDDDVVVLMEPNTFEQLDVPKDMFGEAAVYLKDDMRVIVQLYDERPMSASVPQRVTCKVVEAQAPMKGIAATPHYKKVLLDNGLTVQVPPFILTGDEIVINTTDNSYMTRA
uniref:Elongation factor P n=1 Tax=Davidia involucrata TaxID=16924 RepID=A0A5B7CA45_DAVIN